MEETLTNCLLSTREDLSELKRVREYLDSNTESQTKATCSVSWRTIEAFNSILATCASQDTPDIQALDTLLDTLYFLACNNEEESVWSNFGFELGVIFVKILSAIEQTDMFDVLFCKFLAVINKICQHNSDAWKAVARQILNVFINKKFDYSYFETVLKVYAAILRNVDANDMYNFAKQNHQLLKTLSMLIQRAGDFESQMDILEIVFLHVSNDKKLMKGFFMETKDEIKKLFQKLQFTDFEKDSRTYLNALNENLGTERKVYSIGCRRLILGGISLEPPPGRETIWMDANKDSERLTIKCSDFSDSNDSVDHCIVYIQFPDLISIQSEREVISQMNSYRLMLKTQNLKYVHERVKNDDVVCCTDFSESVLEFTSFLDKIINSKGDETKNKRRVTEGEKKLSQTCDQLVIDRLLILKNSSEPESSELQDNSISSSITNKKSGIRRIIPNALSLFEKIENETTEIKIKEDKTYNSPEKTSPYFPDDLEECRKPSQKFSMVLRSQNLKQSPLRNEKTRNVILETQELTPNSFVESLNKNLGLDSPEVKHTFEDSLETVKFPNKNATAGGRKSHKLFRSPNKIFNFLDGSQETGMENDFIFQEKLEDKENIEPNGKNNDFKFPLSQIKREKSTSPVELTASPRVLRERKCLEIKLTDSQSDKYFRSITSSFERKKKPSLPKLKRTSNKTKKSNEDKQGKTSTKPKITESKVKERKQTRGRRQSKKTEPPVVETVRSSLLDPNGYAFQRWLQPTTSERSNFWLKKLNENLKEKSKNVYDFSDESEFEYSTMVRKRRSRKKNTGKVVRTTKRKRETKKSKKEESSRSEPPLKQVKNTLKSRTYPKLEELVTKKEKPTLEKAKKTTENKGKAKENQKVKDETQLRDNKFVSESPFKSSFENSILRSSKAANSLEVGIGLKEEVKKSTETYSEDFGNDIERNYDKIITRRSSTDESFINEEKIKKKELDLPELDLQEKDELEEKLKNEEEEEEEEEEVEEDEEEIFSSSEDEALKLEDTTAKKRERSDEENSLTKTFIKKKSKTQKKDENRFLTSSLQTRLRKRQEKIKQETDEIIETVKKATNQLLNHVQQKQARQFVSYLTSAKDAGSRLEESEDSRTRIKRLERVVVFMKAGCSVSEICDSADEQLGKIRKALKDLAKPGSDSAKKIERFNDRLKSLIETEIDKSIKKEYVSKRNRLMRCASVFGSKLGGSFL